MKDRVGAASGSFPRLFWMSALPSQGCFLTPSVDTQDKVALIFAKTSKPTPSLPF